ncbi:MAG: flagellar hook-basal body complex protein [Holosporaceae bacterium]
MPTNPNETVRSNPSFTTTSDAAMTSAVGMETYEDSLAHFGKHLANLHSLGYMHDTLCHATNGPNGEQVRGIEINNFDDQARGPLHNTERELDIAVNGRGFMIVDASGSVDNNTPIEHGMKTTGSFQLDRDGYIYDEGGNTLLGVPVEDDGSVSPFSLIEHLERIKIPLNPSQADATTNIAFGGILPADNIEVNDVKENAVDVFDSLGVVHQLRFSWTFLAPRIWQLTAQDSQNAKLTQDTINGDSWVNTPLGGRGGCIVGFDVNGDYQGTVPTSNAEFQAFDTANLSLDGANSASEYILQKSREEPGITTAALVTATQNHINTTYPATTHPNENTAGLAVANAMTNATLALALQEAETERATYEAAQETAFQALETVLVPSSRPPNVYVTDWRNSEGELVGSSNSTIALDPSAYRLTGNQFIVQTPVQDGMGSTSFKGIDVSSNGIISFEFYGQPSKPAWAIPLIHYPNNNGMVQDTSNVLRPTPECGDFYVLSTPLTSNLGSTEAKTIVQSNVNAQKALLGGHTMARATEVNTTLFKIAVELDKFVIQTIAQIS